MSNKNKKRKPGEPLPPPTIEKGDEKKSLFNSYYNVIMFTVTLLGILYSIGMNYYEKRKNTPTPIEEIHNQLVETKNHIEEEFKSLSTIELHDVEDSINLEKYKTNVRKMIRQWDNCKDLDIPQQLSIAEIDILKGKIISRNVFEANVSDVIRSIRVLYNSELIKSEENMFPDAQRVNAIILRQTMCINKDSTYNNEAIKSLELLKYKIGSRESFSKGELEESIRKIREYEEDVFASRSLLDFFMLIKEIGNSYDNIKV